MGRERSFRCRLEETLKPNIVGPFSKVKRCFWDSKHPLKHQQSPSSITCNDVPKCFHILLTTAGFWISATTWIVRQWRSKPGLQTLLHPRQGA